MCIRAARTEFNGLEKGFLAFLVLSALSIVFLLTAKFDQLVKYIGFTLTIFAALAVVGAFILRAKRPDAPRPYKAFGWPVTPIIFVCMSVWIVYYGVKLEPKLSCLVLDIDSDDCSCTAAITLYNDCAADMMASDFEFTRCEDYDNWDSTIFDCLVLPPGWQGELALPLQQDAPYGAYEDTLHLTIDGEQYALGLRYEVASVSLGGCGCGATGDSSIPFGVLLMIGIAAARSYTRSRED